uniref:hypothetical protein n=1 Tax=Thermogutta sp. TaxID=1962930 RepID=UPI0032202BA3
MTPLQKGYGTAAAAEYTEQCLWKTLRSLRPLRLIVEFRPHVPRPSESPQQGDVAIALGAGGSVGLGAEEVG